LEEKMTDENLKKIQNYLLKNGFLFEISELKNLDEEILLDLWKHLDSKISVLLVVFKNKEELINFLKKNEDERRIEAVSFYKKSFLPVCKNCGFLDEGALKIGKCPNCDEEYY
jgi:rubrerythrin